MTRRPHPHDQRGAVAVEFALVAWIAIVFLVLGSIELGRMLLTLGTANEVTRMGARLAVVCGADAEIVKKRMVELMPTLAQTSIDVRQLPSGCAPDSTNPCKAISVSIQPGTRFETFLPLGHFSSDLPAFTTTLTGEALDSTSCT